MSNHARRQNLDAYIEAVKGAAVTSITAAGAGDATEVTGTTVDRANSAGHINVDSILFVLAMQVNLTSGKKITIIGTVEESDDDSSWSTAAAAVQPGGAAGGTLYTVTTTDQDGTVDVHAVDCTGLKRYVRLKFTPDLDASGTDTAILSLIAIKGGGVENPVTT